MKQNRYLAKIFIRTIFANGIEEDNNFLKFVDAYSTDEARVIITNFILKMSIPLEKEVKLLHIEFSEPLK